MSLAEAAALENWTPPFQELLLKKGLAEEQKRRLFLAPDLKNLYDPFLMAGMRQACQRLTQARDRKEKVFIHGDYDVDGVTGAAIAAHTLKLFGIEHTVFLPERARDGYGVSEAAIRRAAESGCKVLMTVDCGVAAHSAMNLARELGLDTVIVDHHRISAEGLPPAAAILNPQREDCLYPFKELSAGGLAFKLAQALLGDKAFAFLDLAALSTVCDVAPLIDENRIIVKAGLKKLSTEPGVGLAALVQSAGIKTKTINTGHLGFNLGPRINACGRMSTPDIALRLLMTNHPGESASLARVLEEENKSRQQEERMTVKEAIAEAERTFHFNRDRVIVVARRGWHEGVIGIVAARLVDRFYRPAIVIALKDGAAGKGSGRSIKGFNLFEAMASAKDCLTAFGGHEQAAGLSIQEDQVANFRKKINGYALEKTSAEIFVKKTACDLELSLEDLSEKLLAELSLLEPHGAGNPRPVFKTSGLCVKGRPWQKSPQVVQFWVTDGVRTCEASYYAPESQTPKLEEGDLLDIHYNVRTYMMSGVTAMSLDVKTFCQSIPSL
ncbi:MAG: single-stranded-DNA-specific exonuclease RecJ [Candidatus Omnitrophica bacterium]|nr:single-stranded-DNA-specific exonuclease RecJ [Candidatus Omnitrophota bacterium]